MKKQDVFSSVLRLGLLLIMVSFGGCTKSTRLTWPPTPPIQGSGSDELPKPPEGLPDGPSLNLFYPNLPPSEGSLWSDSGDLLFADKRARRVGDTVIVDIVENTSSSINANTNSSRTSTTDVGISNLFGFMRVAEAVRGNLNRDQTGKMVDKLIGSNYGNTFSGQAASDRSGRITASIGARVTEVLPNGNIAIFGKREMKVNNEVQFITVSGVIRPEDIGADNRVQSTFLADSHIAYSGKGIVADKQRPGWLTRIMDNVWPF